MKQCPQCKREGRGPKLLTDFNVSQKDRTGRQSWCRACMKEHQTKNIVSIREGNRKWRANNRDKTRAHSRDWARKNPLAMTAKSLRQEYGITVEQYAEMFEAQGGRCKICDTAILSQLMNTRGTPRRTVAHVDHCHETGRVRGLLCFNCNIGLGKFQDDAQVLLKAMQYLQATPRKQASGTALNFNRWCDENAQGEKRADESRDLVTSTSRGSRLMDLSPLFN